MKLVSPEFTRVLQEGGWCRVGIGMMGGGGDSRNWNRNTSEAQIFNVFTVKASCFQSFEVLKFQSFEVWKFQNLKVSKFQTNKTQKTCCWEILIPYYEVLISCFVEDFDPIFKILKILNGYSGLFGPHLSNRIEMSDSRYFEISQKKSFGMISDVSWTI